MERNKKTSLLFLLLALLHVYALGGENCPSVPDNDHAELSCYSDYNRTITCVWNSARVSDPPDNVCTLHAAWKSDDYSYSSSCKLEPVVSRPTLQNCSMIFEKPRNNFKMYHNLSMKLSCNPVKQSLNIFYKPACHIKLNTPPQPMINFTTVSWLPKDPPRRTKFSYYISQLQWKQEDESWSDHSEQTKEKQCTWDCAAELDPDRLIQGERYEARIRVKAAGKNLKSTWSDWSPTASWVSPVGRTKDPPPSSDLPGGVFGIVAGVAVLAVFLVVIRLKTDKTTWVYMVKTIRGPPLPSPAKSFLQDSNFQNWLSPHFTSDSFHSFFNPVEIVSVEVTSAVDAVAPCGPEAALLEKIRNESSHDSSSSNFSNPSYSQLCPPPPPPPPPPVSSLTAGNLAPCAADTPYGPLGGQSEGKNAEQDRDEVRGKGVEICQLLSKGSNNSEPALVVSDYEKVEKLQVRCARLQSLDSGVCSGEEVSQESFEADSINVTDEGPEGEEGSEGGNGKDFQKLFGGSCFGKGSIEVCSGYERVQKLQDSGISSGGEEQVSQEEKSTESTSLLSPPPPPLFSASPCSLPSFTPLPFNFSEPGSSLRPLPSHLLERIALMSTSRSVEPSGGGYMPVRQEQS